jgi:hypothetical protein
LQLTLTNRKSVRISGKYSDFVITCGNETFNVHKVVVCGRSGFFERAERFAVGKVRMSFLLANHSQTFSRS